MDDGLKFAGISAIFPHNLAFRTSVLSIHRLFALGFCSCAFPPSIRGILIVDTFFYELSFYVPCAVHIISLSSHLFADSIIFPTVRLYHSSYCNFYIITLQSDPSLFLLICNVILCRSKLLLALSSSLWHYCFLPRYCMQPSSCFRLLNNNELLCTLLLSLIPCVQYLFWMEPPKPDVPTLSESISIDAADVVNVEPNGTLRRVLSGRSPVKVRLIDWL